MILMLISFALLQANILVDFLSVPTPMCAVFVKVKMWEEVPSR